MSRGSRWSAIPVIRIQIWLYRPFCPLMLFTAWYDGPSVGRFLSTPLCALLRLSPSPIFFLVTWIAAELASRHSPPTQGVLLLGPTDLISMFCFCGKIPTGWLVAGIVGPIGRQRRLGCLDHLARRVSEAFTRILGAVKMHEGKVCQRVRQTDSRAVLTPILGGRY